MTYSTLDHRIDEGILTITLNRPDNLNAFTPTMADELERTFNATSHNDEVRAIVVTGAGRAFCAGMDLGVEGNVFGLDESRSPTLADMSDLDSSEIRRVRDTGGRFTLAIRSCLKPDCSGIG